MKLPRFARRWAVRVDTASPSQPANVAFASGPFKDRFFWRERSARSYAAGVNLDENRAVWVMRLGWLVVEP